jgi:hypothetical protein
MTVMCERFFAIPQAFIRLGKIKELSPIALKLYIALWHESERYSTRELKRTVAQLQKLVGGSRNSYTKAKSELAQAGLLSAEAYGSEGFIFHLFDPETGKPWPLGPKEKPPYQRKGASNGASTQAPTRSTKPQTIPNTGADFDFGFNDPRFSPPSNELERNGLSISWNEIGK